MCCVHFLQFFCVHIANRNVEKFTIGLATKVVSHFVTPKSPLGNFSDPKAQKQTKILGKLFLFFYK